MCSSTCHEASTILCSSQDSLPGLPSRGSWGSLLHLSFITRAEDQQSGGMKHTTHGSTTHGSCCETSYCFHFHRRRKLKGKVLMCLFQMRNRERDWEHHGFEDSASHMISGCVVLVVPGGLLLNMALAAPHMKMRTALTQPHSTLRRQSLFWIKQFHYKMVKAETFHAWWLRLDGLLPRQRRTSCRDSRNSMQSAAEDLPALQKLCLCQRQP